ncbi:uncharacterized protein LOC127764203 [Oryza glaberrima]|uniref:uncharacterized protein LOC127764203 n=1 Tax=Oryza glaberrima TaxID=4538 RepID=UPI00224C4A65|nr:uncharacterized protein LOC127764203 [Oryza glaberrima]
MAGMVVVGVGVPRFSRWSAASVCPVPRSSRRDPLLLVGVVVPLVPAGSRRGAVASVVLLLRRRIDGVPCFSFPAASAASSMLGSCIPLASSCISPSSPSLFIYVESELAAGELAGDRRVD